MDLFGKDAAMGGYKQKGVSLVIPGGDTGCPADWSRVLGDVGQDDEEGGKYPCGVPTPDQGEAGKMAGRRVNGETCRERR